MKTTLTRITGTLAVDETAVVAETNTGKYDGRLISNTGTGDLYVGLGEAPTTTAYEYLLSAGTAGYPIDAGSDIALHFYSPQGTTYSVKPYTS